MNYSPTIRWDYEKFKKMFSSTITTTTKVLQFAYAEVFIDFCKFCNFPITNIFYIVAPRHQMGDFGRQISQ